MLACWGLLPLTCQLLLPLDDSLPPLPICTLTVLELELALINLATKLPSLLEPNEW